MDRIVCTYFSIISIRAFINLKLSPEEVVSAGNLAMSSDRERLDNLVQLLLLLRGDLHNRRVLNDTVRAGSSRNRNDFTDVTSVRIGPDPSKCELRRRHPLLLGKRLDLVNKLEVLGKVLKKKGGISNNNTVGRTHGPLPRAGTFQTYVCYLPEEYPQPS